MNKNQIGWKQLQNQYELELIKADCLENARSAKEEKDDEYNADYPLGGSLEPYDIERDNIINFN